jgi:hypothetical protein
MTINCYPTPGIHKEPVENANQLKSAKTVIATIDRLTNAKTGDGLLQSFRLWQRNHNSSCCSLDLTWRMLQGQDC